jgi:putative hemolysin
LLTNIKNAVPVMLPVNSFGKTDPNSMKKIADTYKSETNIFTFPAGSVSRIVDGKVRDKVWNKSFVVNARAYQREIVPVFIDNINSKLFYRVYKIRKFLRIKTNLELFLLSHELFSSKNSVIKMKIGKAIPHTVFADTISEFDWAQKIKEHVYTFPENHNKIFVA